MSRFEVDELTTSAVNHVVIAYPYTEFSINLNEIYENIFKSSLNRLMVGSYCIDLGCQLKSAVNN